MSTETVVAAGVAALALLFGAAGIGYLIGYARGRYEEGERAGKPDAPTAVSYIVGAVIGLFVVVFAPLWLKGVLIGAAFGGWAYDAIDNIAFRRRMRKIYDKEDAA